MPLDATYRSIWPIQKVSLRIQTIQKQLTAVNPRLREVEHGYEDVQSQEEKRNIHGWFYYRFEGGESPADCYDRASAALESILRQASRKNKKHAIIFTHGLTIRCIVARFLHLTVEEFESLANPGNCDTVTLAKLTHLKNPVFKRGQWGVEGIRLRPAAASPQNF